MPSFAQICRQRYQIIIIAEEYRGEHAAPGKGGDDAPMHDLKGIYPDDIYSADAVRLYSTGESYDGSAIAEIKSARGRPNKAVKVYRVIPEILSSEEQILRYEKYKRYIQKTGKNPPEADTNGKNPYYEWLNDEIEKLQKVPNIPQKRSINKGDWVTIVRQYAVDHGKSALNGKYKIVTKTVKAKDLYTNGNSIHEWGYDP